MRKIALLLCLAALCAAPLAGQNQKLTRGQKAPELLVKEWINSRQPQQGKAMMIEFFHSGNSASVERLKSIEELAGKGRNKVNVIVLTREDNRPVREMLSGKAYYAGIDDEGKSFGAFSARYVPYAVIVDKRGRVSWLGNPSSLTHSEILSMMQ